MAKFGHVKKKQYLCTRFRPKGIRKNVTEQTFETEQNDTDISTTMGTVPDHLG